MNADTDGSPIAGGMTSPPAINPSYGTSSNPATSSGNARKTKCVTGPRFLKSIHGILNIVIIISLVFVLICAGVADSYNGKQADAASSMSKVRISAYSTRNAVLTFAVIGLILILVDTIFYATGLILHVPPKFDTITIVIMVVLAGIFLILGCCAAAWEQKMKDTVGVMGIYQRKGAAGASSFFLFVAMIATIADLVLRLVRPAKQEENQ